MRQTLCQDGKNIKKEGTDSNKGRDKEKHLKGKKLTNGEAAFRIEKWQQREKNKRK